jgi:hypothetical protein
MWHTPVVPALIKLRQEDREFEVSLGYLVRPYFKKIKNKMRSKFNFLFGIVSFSHSQLNVLSVLFYFHVDRNK